MKRQHTVTNDISFAEMYDSLYERDFGIHLGKNPAGTYSFDGTVPVKLTALNKDGSELSDEEADKVSKASNPGMISKVRVFKLAKDAFKAADKLGIKKSQIKFKESAPLFEAKEVSLYDLSVESSNEELIEAKLPSQYTNKIKGIDAKAFDWFMKYQTEFDKKEFGFPKLNISKVSVNTSALSDKQRSRIVDKLGFDHRKQAAELNKIIPKLKQKWNEIQEIAHMKTYNEKPGFGSYKISGIGDDKYPDEFKKQLRTLAHMETLFKSAFSAHKAFKGESASLFERGPADVKFKTDKVKGHSHLGTTDESGNGKTIKTNGSGDDHVHKVTDNEVQPSSGHIHKIQGMKESFDLMEGTTNQGGKLEIIQGGSTVILFFASDKNKSQSLMVKLDLKDWEKFKLGGKGEKVKAYAASLGIWESAPTFEKKITAHDPNFTNAVLAALKDADPAKIKKVMSAMADGKFSLAASLLAEGATENAKGTLQAIIGSLKKFDPKSDMLKMANGIMDHFKKEGSFSPDQAKWIWKTSVALFK